MAEEIKITIEDYGPGIEPRRLTLNKDWTEGDELYITMKVVLNISKGIWSLFNTFIYLYGLYYFVNNKIL